MSIIQHSAKSVEHYTPKPIVDAAWAVMGGIDLDPASCAIANTQVGSKHYFTEQDDGLCQPWFGNVFLNPPGGKTKNRSNAAIWWQYLVEEWQARRIYQAVFVGFTLEIMATSQDSDLSVLDFPICVPRHRLPFSKEVWINTSEDGPIVPVESYLDTGTSPPHSNVIVYLPPIVEGWGVWDPAGVGVADFKAAFSQFGKVRV